MRCSRWILPALLGLGYAVALIHGGLGLAALPVFAALIVTGWMVQPAHALWLKSCGHLLFVLLAFALALHWLPGFDNALVIDNARLSADAAPFSIAMNLDKPLIGLWLLLACPWILGVRRTTHWLLWILPGTLLLCLGGAWLAGFVAWAPKWPDTLWIFALNNLLLVSLTEEALFRGYLLGSLQRLFAPLRHGNILALLIAASLFGLAHAGGGLTLVALATLAGLGYGLVWRHGGLVAAWLTHFAVNIAHFTLLTYPHLAAP